VKRFLYQVKKYLKNFQTKEVLGGVLLLLLIFGLTFVFDDQTEQVIAFVQSYPYLGPFLYVIFLTFSIVLMPLSSLPVAVFATPIWGIFWGSTLSAIGWWFGAMLLFLLVRHLGRPALARFVSLGKLETWEERIPSKVTFTFVLLSHLLLPVEIPAAVFGLTKRLSFKLYAGASFLGIFPTAYLFVPAGGAVLEQNWAVAGIYGGLLLLVFLTAFFVWHKYYFTPRKKNGKSD
jgi:uncharacterized membrane protein YdjX (TVP38/TMEM64 family)